MYVGVCVCVCVCTGDIGVGGEVRVGVGVRASSIARKELPRQTAGETETNESASCGYPCRSRGALGLPPGLLLFL